MIHTKQYAPGRWRRMLAAVGCGTLALCIAATAPASAEEPSAEPVDLGPQLVANPTFAEGEVGDLPPGWDHRTAGQGYVKLAEEAGERFVSIGLNSAGEDSFIQQIVKLPEDAVSVRVSATYRYSDVVPGAKGHMQGKVQARLTEAGREIGGWIGLGDLTGTSEGWVSQVREVAVPERADGLMLRIGFYSPESGRIDVQAYGATVVTQAMVEARRAAFRPAEPFGPAVTQSRYDNLKHGLNINEWMCQPFNVRLDGEKGGYTAEHFRRYITERDIAMIRDMGFDHVRLAIDPGFIMDDAGHLKPDLLGEVDRAIQMILNTGMAVIVDVHPKTNRFKAMRDNPVLARQFVPWWGQFARHLSSTDPERVFLELLNEPGGQQFYGQQWSDYQDKLIMEVLRNAPEHTIIASSGGWQLVKDLAEFEPHPDRNIIYAVHYYEPSQFTHQGAMWMKDWYRPLKGVPWPVTEENLDVALAAVDEKHPAAEQAKKVLRDMVKQGIATHERMLENMRTVAAWSKQHDRKVIINEFGVYIDFAPRESRLIYLDALTKAMADNDIHWSLWAYDANYDVVLNVDDPEARTPDTEVVEALNLRPAAAMAE
ncbi:MAG: glycoside hydrolase family 5 protein [Phycisphaerae bacterium]